MGDVHRGILIVELNIITLGRERYIKGTHRKIDYLMSCFFFTKSRQTQMYKETILSLPKIIQKNADDPSATADEMQHKLQLYLERFFSVVNLSVDYEVNEDNTSTIVLDINVGDDQDGLISVGYSLTHNYSNLVNILATHSGQDLMQNIQLLK